MSTKYPLDTELLEAKVVKSMRDDIGDAAVKEFICLSDEELKAEIARCTLEQDEASRKTKENSNYAKAQEVLRDFRSALNSTNAPLKRRIKVATFVLGVRKSQK